VAATALKHYEKGKSKMTFTLSRRTLSIIENFSNINPAMVFRKGKVLSTITPSNAPDMFAFAKIDETIPAQFGVNDISRFLSVLSLYKEPSLSATDLVLTIQGQNQRKYTYTLTADKMIRTIAEDDIELPTPFAEFKLTASDLVSLKKHVDVADLPNIVFEGDGKIVEVKGLKVEDSTSDQYVAMIGLANKKINVKFDKWKITTLMDADYSVGICESAIHFKSDFLDYYVAPELGSSFNETA
jgi:hypothetical protein